MNTTNIVIVILVLALVGSLGFNFYLYSGVMQCKAVATDLGTKLQSCGAGLTECVASATACQEALASGAGCPPCPPCPPCPADE